MPTRTPRFDLVANNATQFDINFSAQTQRLQSSALLGLPTEEALSDRRRYVEEVNRRRGLGQPVAYNTAVVAPTVDSFIQAFTTFIHSQRMTTLLLAEANANNYDLSLRETRSIAQIATLKNQFLQHLITKVRAYYNTNESDLVRIWNLITTTIEDPPEFRENRETRLESFSVSLEGLYSQGALPVAPTNYGLNRDDNSRNGYENVLKFKLFKYNFAAGSRANNVRTVEALFGCKFDSFPSVVKKMNKIFATWMPQNPNPTRVFFKKNLDPLAGEHESNYTVWIVNSASLRRLWDGRVRSDTFRQLGITVNHGRPVWYTPIRVTQQSYRFRRGATPFSVIQGNNEIAASAMRLRSLPAIETEEEIRIRQQIRQAVQARGTYIPTAAPARPQTYNPSGDINMFIRSCMDHIGTSVLVTDQNRNELARIINQYLGNDVYLFAANPGHPELSGTFRRNIRPLVHEFLKIGWKIHRQYSEADGQRPNFGGGDAWSQVPGFPCLTRADFYPHPQADSTMPRQAFKCQFKIKRSHMERLFQAGEHGPRQNRSNIKNEIHQVLRKVNELAAIFGFKITTKMVRPIGPAPRPRARPAMQMNPDGSRWTGPVVEPEAPSDGEQLPKQRIFIIENLVVPGPLQVDTHFLGRVIPVDPTVRQVPSFFQALENVRNELLTFLGNPIVEVVPNVVAAPPQRPNSNFF